MNLRWKTMSRREGGAASNGGVEGETVPGGATIGSAGGGGNKMLQLHKPLFALRG